jgi:ABC-type multidrug transport system ATPase subunit
MSEQTSSRPIVAELDHVTVPNKERPILRDVSLCAMQGEVVVIHGPSGSGKSTILRTLNGIVRPPEGCGDARLFGQSLRETKPRKWNKMIADRVGIGFQAPLLPSNYTLFNGFRGLADAQGKEVDLARMARLATRLGFTPEQLDQPIGTLSGGEQQRAAFCRLFVERNLLLLDEPTSPIGPAAKADFYQMLKECREETPDLTTIIVSHDVDQALAIADREIVIESGRVVGGEPYPATASL